jgi:peptide/nickel transport system substrate-binding protein
MSRALPAVLTATLAAAACTSHWGAHALATAAPAAAALSLAWEAEPRTVDPRYAVDANSQYLEDLLHCSLVDFDKDGRTIPDLAKSWTWTSPTLLTVELKAGAKFGDGTPVTAADVVATYMFFKNDKLANPSPRQGAFANTKAVTAKGTGTVQFELTAPDSTFVTNLVVGVLPATFAAKEMLTDKDQVAGCGPFRLKAVTPSGLELEANPQYSLAPPPKLKNVMIKVDKD